MSLSPEFKQLTLATGVAISILVQLVDESSGIDKQKFVDVLTKLSESSSGGEKTKLMGICLKAFALAVPDPSGGEELSQLLH